MTAKKHREIEGIVRNVRGVSHGESAIDVQDGQTGMVGVDRRVRTTWRLSGGRPLPFGRIARLAGAFAALLLGPAGALANEPVVPVAPEEPAAAKAFAVFDQHCARCHQAGKLKGLRAARGFGNILDLKASASNPALVIPGNPDGSKLYTMMLSRAMPYDVAHDAKGVEPTSSDLMAVRDWVQSLPARPLCAERAPIQSLDVQGAILQALSAAGNRARQLRFISFEHLHNACAPAADIKGYAEAVTRLINSLSSALEPVTLEAIDGGKTLFSIDIERIGWDAQRWERLATIYPYGAAPGLQDATGSKSAVVRGDWLAFAATRAPLYYELLGLPDRLQALQSGLQVDVIGDLASARARRIGIKTSAIARGSRLAQRHLIANGSYWITSEYAPTPGRADVFDAPIGPAARGTQKPDANLVMFNLPNGFNAFFIANTDGVRVNDLPQSVLRNEASPNHRVGAGLACLTCHDSGPKGGMDELRGRLQQDTVLARDVRERLLTIHGTAEEHQRLMAEDAERLNRAAAAAGLTPALQIHGLSPIEALATRYRRPVDAGSAAAELGIDAAALAALRDKATGGARDLLDRLQSGLVSRSDFEERFVGLATAAAGAVAPAGVMGSSVAGVVPQVVTSDPSGELELILKADKIAFKTGDLLSVKARVNSNCYLTLISVDRNGRGTVIFPNDFEQNNLIEVGREIQVPSPSAPYQFRLRDKGRETLVGVCGASQRPADGIKHDFERQRFTELGDYRAFLGRTWTTESEERRGVASRADPKLKRAKGKGPGDNTARYEPQARTAIQIDVK